MKESEDIDSALNPHRAEERAAANMEVAGRLQRRGIVVTGREDSEELADLLTAVEHFEAAVEQRGGDLMVDDLRSTEPDDPHFVVPRRARGESLRRYIGRIDEATARLRNH
ncbi:MAG: hypothetical protein ABI647_03610 [Gemmatimonadota bacterium]